MEETGKFFYLDADQGVEINFYRPIVAGVLILATMGFILWAAPRVFQPIWEFLDGLNINVTQSSPYGLMYGNGGETIEDYETSSGGGYSSPSSYGQEVSSTSSITFLIIIIIITMITIIIITIIIITMVTLTYLQYRTADDEDDLDGVLSNIADNRLSRRNYDEAPALTHAMKNSMKILNKMRLLQ